MSSLQQQPPTSLRLSRRQTFTAKSSQYTRAADSLTHPSTTDNTTTGLSFVAVHSTLNQLFQNASNTPSLPSPPPPLPPTRTLENSPPPPPIVTTSSVSSDTSSDAPARVATPPPLDAMFTRSKTRHQKVTKASLADLPPELLHQQPLVRGGVVLYTAQHDPHGNEFTHFVEISAEEYIQSLRSTIRGLQMQLTLGAHSSAEKRATTPKVYPRALRMSSFINKRSKESNNDPPIDKTAKTANRTTSFLTRRTSIAHAPPPPDRDERNSTENRKLKPTVSFPNGFGFEDSSEATASTSAASHVTFSTTTSEIPASQPPEPVSMIATVPGAPSSGRSAREKSIGFVDMQQGSRPKSMNPGRRASISIDRTISPNIMPLQQGDSNREKSMFNRNKERTVSQKKKDGSDREAGPMPGSKSRRVSKMPSVTRTRSFSGLFSDTLTRRDSHVGLDADRVTRAFSMHHEPLAASTRQAPPTNNKPVERFSLKKSRAIRMFLGRRSAK